MIIGGIYGYAPEDIAVSDGRNLFYLFNGINDIQSDVELGSSGGAPLIEGYSLSFNTKDKRWKIKDTGHKGCIDVIASGDYGEGFEGSLKSLMRMFSK